MAAQGYMPVSRREPAVTSSATRWEDLRKEARHLENEIDIKLVSFSKLGTSQDLSSLSSGASFGGSALGRAEAGAAGVDAGTGGVGGGGSSSGSDGRTDALNTTGLEIEQLLASLSRVNDAMSEYSQRGAVPNSALLHTMQRHRDILNDYEQEFRKTRSNIVQTREREDLLNSVQRDINSYHNQSASASGRRRPADYYLKEHQHLNSSHQMVEDQLGLVVATKENLMHQRATFSNITSRVSNVFNRFPVINNLIQRINVRKRRDAIILGSVISVCIILLLLQVLR